MRVWTVMVLMPPWWTVSTTVANMRVFRGSYGGSVEEHWRFGYEMGVKFKEDIRVRLSEMAQEPATRALSDIFDEERYDGKVLAEVQGIADGSGFPYESILALNLREEMHGGVSNYHTQGCSDYTAPPVVGHNEDNRASERNRTFLAEVTIDGTSFVALVYAGELPTAGFGWNEKVAFTTDYVEPVDFLNTGYGRVFVARSLLAASSVEAALEIASWPHVAGHNYQIFNKTHFYVGEVARDIAVFRFTTKPIFKANEYDWIHIPQRIGPSTVHRTARALAQLPKPHSATDVLNVLWDDADVDASGRYGIYCPTCTLCTLLFDGPRVTIYVDKRIVYERPDWAVLDDWKTSLSSNMPRSEETTLLRRPFVLRLQEEAHPTNLVTAVFLRLSDFFRRLGAISQWWFAGVWICFCLLLLIIGRSCFLGAYS